MSCEPLTKRRPSGSEGAAGWNEMNPAAKAAKAKMDDDEEEGLARAKDDDPHNMDL